MKLSNTTLTLHDIIENIEQLDEETYIFLAGNKDQWSAQSEAIVIEISDDPSQDKLSVKGFSYFLETFLAFEVVNELIKSKDHPSTSEKIDTVIHYALFDA